MKDFSLCRAVCMRKDRPNRLGGVAQECGPMWKPHVQLAPVRLTPSPLPNELSFGEG